MRLLIAIMLVCVLAAGCKKSPNEPKAVDSNSLFALPGKAEVNIASNDEAFSIILNSQNRSERYAATLYLKSHLGEDTSLHYGNILYQVFKSPNRVNVYESLGFFGGRANASHLAHYLQADGDVGAKVQIICSMGLIGPDADQFVPLIEKTRDSYPKYYQSWNFKDDSTAVKDGDITWLIQKGSIKPEQLTEIANKAIKMIRPAAQ